ncbi:hypothetical protein RUM43_004965 [Polyplax serrata]|uniref:Uncharacterized protein n=1 Tax=Polyplax serrata TaxID=468196 RepID=A0AAN8SEM0_POLSC
MDGGTIKKGPQETKRTSAFFLMFCLKVGDVRQRWPTTALHRWRQMLALKKEPLACWLNTQA